MKKMGRLISSFLAVCTVLIWSTAATAATQTASPTTCVTVAGTNNDWSNAGRAVSSNNSYATVSVNDNQTSDYLQCTNYGFTIPAGATINGITVNVERYSSNANATRDAAMRLVKAGVIQATDRSTATFYPTADTYEAHGGNTDLWGTTWTPADINNANFGAAFASVKPVTAGGGRTVSVDHIQITVDYTPVISVSSINRASTNPTEPATVVSWTVIFSASVSGVDAADFTLVQAGGVTGASITSVTGSGTTWTVTANTGSGTGTLGLNLIDDDSIYDSGSIPLGGAGAGNGNFTGEVYTVSPPFCTPPSNIPAGVSVTCVCDRFGRASLNPSTIFGGNWSVSNSDGLGNPAINSTTGLLRLTESTANNAKAATVPGIFPAAGNYISVEFNHYAYDGTGADGIAVTLSDYSVPAVPGAFGGSLGYAQRTGVVGFAGGWVGVALDEYGNYQNPTEGRVGGPGFRVQSIGVRGPGSGANGYRWMGGTASNPGGLNIDNRTSTTPAPGYMYQVIVDARSFASGTVDVSVNRDATTNNGSNYVSLFGPFNAYTEANYALSQGWISQLVPDYWKISFTGSTGGSDNIHEIGDLRVCAQTVYPPTGGTASGFSAIDEAYPGAPTVPAYPNFQTGNIYMKLAGTPFNLWVAALTSTGLSTGYSAISSKYVAVKFVDNSDNACGTDAARTCNAACTNKTAVEAGATQIATFASGGTTGVASPSPTFTLNSAWKNLIAVMKECTTSACTAFTATAPACSADSFSVRPASIASVTSSNATNTGTTGAPIFKAGADTFSLTATTTGIAGSPSGYTGILKINSNTSGAVLALSPATNIGTIAPTTFPAATSGTPSSTATGSNFTYSEVGGFYFRGYNPATNATASRGIYDGVDTVTECAAPVTLAQCDTLRAATWTGIDSISTEADCVSNNYSNTKVGGKYGCSFGIVADTGGFGRFTPHHFEVTKIHGCTGGATFTYSGQPFTVTATARNFAGVTTQNYHGAYGLSKDTRISDAGTDTNFTPNHNTTSNNDLAAASFVNGVGTQGTVTYTFPVTAPPKETAPTTLTLRAIDADLVSSAGYTEEQAEIRSGRVRIQNAYGSELAALPVPMRVEYFEDTTITAPATNPPVTGWITNSADTCTSVPATGLSLANNVLPSPVTPPTAKTIGAQTTSATVANSPFFTGSGDAGLQLSAPGQGGDGYVDITANLSAKTWLRFDWHGTGDVDPTGRASFGLYRGSPKHIYLRQRYN